MKKWILYLLIAIPVLSFVLPAAYLPSRITIQRESSLEGMPFRMH